jgi:hypothetical protein
MGNSNLVLRTVYISPELDDELRLQAFRKGTSKNDLIRQYLVVGMRTEVAKAASAGGKVIVRAVAKKPVRVKASTKKGLLKQGVLSARAKGTHAGKAGARKAAAK